MRKEKHERKNMSLTKSKRKCPEYNIISFKKNERSGLEKKERNEKTRSTNSF